MMRLFPGLALLTLLAAGPALAAPERVTIDRPGGLKLEAMLYRPAGPGPHPAIVALHGCGGLWRTRSRRAVTARSADWAERLTGLGFVVLFPDSFGSRGLGSQCTVKARLVRPAPERVADAKAARDWLATRPDVRADRIGLIGWSNGGSTVLYTVRPREAPKPGKPDFSLAVAFYPGCRLPDAKAAFASRVPLLILIGEADNWTPAEACRKLAAHNASNVTLKTYPGAYHDFDDASQKLHKRTGLANSADGTGTAMSGLDPAARADAITRVPAFLAPLLKGAK
jgi:dienelactone hydrolase